MAVLMIAKRMPQKRASSSASVERLKIRPIRIMSCGEGGGGGRGRGRGEGRREVR